ncbi:hypothetical protein [Paraburkholderia youngii]|uniref:Lipoprotein n=1 Tax=Paraburkholderia youngii TaxID=2782701 RepID=A0A7Y6K875_9BURK|nr:hypothetical protein [Paraburkholderia youngii]NUY06235.1 hypothetical protein [Paraburkholderia youngii]
MRRISLLLASATLAGCATHIVPVEQAAQVPATRIVDTTYTTPHDDAQRITIIRNAGAASGSLSGLTISVDGKATAEMATGEALPLYLPKGEHLVTAKFGVSFLAPASLALTTPSRFPVVRFDMDSGGARLQPALE